MIPITSEDENERYLEIVDRLIELGDRLTPKQNELLRLLVVLIERFEAERYTLERAEPREVLRELMDARGMKIADLADIIGSKGVASEILSGKRGLSKGNIRKLADFFGVSPEVFL